MNKQQLEIALLSEEDGDTVGYFKENFGYFISYDDLFSTWISIGKDDVSNVRDAFSHLVNPKEAHKNETRSTLCP